MSYRVLALKYRSQTFEEVVGQQHVTQTLANAIAADRVAHAMLFAGPRGTGKTTIARIMAKAMNCEKGPIATPCNECLACREITAGNSADVFEIDGASNNSVDQVRELRENARYKPAYSRHKIYIIDEVHMLSVSAFNALLKTLEEPPTHVLFMFATTESQKIPVTILSRCQRHDLRRIRLNRIVDHMQEICVKEEIAVPEESLTLIAKESDGSMRDALSLLDQVLVTSGGEIQHEVVLDILGAVDQALVEEMALGLLSNDIPLLLKRVDRAYHYGQDLYRLFADLLNHIRLLLTLKLAPNAQMETDLPGLEISKIKKTIADTPVDYLAQLFEALYKEEPGMRRAAFPRMALEMILIKVGQIKPVLPVEQLIEKLDLLRREIHEIGISGNFGRIASAEDVMTKKTPKETKTSRLETPKQVPKVAGAPGAEGVQTDIEPSPVAMSPSKLEATKGSAKDLWATIVAKVGDAAPSLGSSLADSRLKSQKGNTLTVLFEGRPFDLKRVKKPDNLNLISRMAREVIGAKVQVVFEADGVEKKQTRKKNNKQREIALQRKALNHPMVEEALKKFEGEIVRVNIPQGDEDEGHG